MKLRLDQIKDRLNRLTDAYLDQALDKTMFEERKKSLLFEKKTVEENLANQSDNESRGPNRLEKFLELLGSVSLSHEMASPEEKREMVNILTSNRQVDGKKLDLKPSIPFREIANRFENTTGAPERAHTSNLGPITDYLIKVKCLRPVARFINDIPSSGT